MRPATARRQAGLARSAHGFEIGSDAVFADHRQNWRLAPQVGLEPTTLRLTATSFKTTWDDRRRRAPFSLGSSSAGGNPGRPDSTPDCPQFVPETGSGFAPESWRRYSCCADSERRLRSTALVPKRQDLDSLWITSDPVVHVVTNSREVEPPNVRQRDVQRVRSDIRLDRDDRGRALKLFANRVRRLRPVK